MSEKVITIGEIKADKTGDCRHWTPLEALEALVRDIKSGEIVPDGSMCLQMWLKREDGGTEFFQRNAGVTHDQAASMLALAQYKNCKSWDD